MVCKVTIHKHMRKRKPKPLFCEFCKERPARDLANLKNHNYTENINDYIWLCHRCHQKLDKTTPSDLYDWNGKKHRLESIEKMSKTKTGMYSGKNNPFYGKHHTIENLEKNRIAHLGNTIRKGSHHTEESKRKMSISMKGRIPWNKGRLND